MTHKRKRVLEAVRGLPFKGIIWSPKREKSSCFCGGQRYSWTKVLELDLLAELGPIYWLRKRPKVFIVERHFRTGSIGRAQCTAATSYWPLRMDLDSIYMAACAPLCLRRGNHARPCSLRICVYLLCGLQIRLRPSTN